LVYGKDRGHISPGEPDALGAGFEVLKAPTEIPDRHVLYRYTATFPWLSPNETLEQVSADAGLNNVLRQVYRPDLYRMAVKDLNVALCKHD
jgi:NitT/TauT family transport system ATP-binding protein/nitrate/nitrite transport system substrate-binding protein